MEFRTLLSIEADKKTSKGSAEGYLTGVCYMAPHTLHGIDGAPSLCPKATAGCIATCIRYTGLLTMPRNVQIGIARARLFLTDRPAFMLKLHDEIHALVRKARKRNMTPAVRLNGVTDIMWERISYEAHGVRYANVMEAFKDVQFYDYTKIAVRHRIARPANYHLTFSQSENNASDVAEALAAGVSVAVVFDKAENIPSVYKGAHVIRGDETDLRFLDPAGCVVGLYAKGRARKDSTGFVVREGN